MPFLYQFEEPLLIRNASNGPGATLKDKEVDTFADRLKNNDIEDALNFILNTDARLCCMKTNVGETLLSIAIYRGSHPLCEALLDKGCDVNEIASFPPFSIKMSPLSYAVTQCNKEMVKLLLKYGCDPTITDDFGRSPIQCAICCGQTEILKLFLDNGCDPNNRIPETTHTLLHEACYRDSCDAVKFLLDAGADPNLYEFNGRTIPAFHTKKLEIHKLLHNKGSDMNWRTRSGETILHSAVTLGHSDLVEYFLQNGAKINLTQTVIMYGRDNMASYIQERGLLQLALREQHYNICLLLIQYGYQVNFKSDEWQLLQSNSESITFLHSTRNIIYEDRKNEICNKKIRGDLPITKEDNFAGVTKHQSLEETCRLVIRKSLALSCPQTSFYYKLKQISYVPEKIIKFVIYD